MAFITLLENHRDNRVETSTKPFSDRIVRPIPSAFAWRARRIGNALALTLVIIAFCSVVAVAQGNSPAQKSSDFADLSIEELMNVNIYSASKRWQKIVEAPASISIVTSDEIQRYGYRTLAEILRSMRGIYIGYDRNYSYIGVRGFSRPGDYNTRVLLLVDGHRVNDNVFGQAYLGTEFPIDVDLIERVELIRGPTSSLYGASAFFGVINVVTKRGYDNRGPAASFETGGFGTYKGRFSYGDSFKNGLEMLVSASFYDSRGQRLFYKEFAESATNNGVAENADYDQSHNLLANFSYRDFRLQAIHGSREKGIPTAAFGTVFNDPRTRTTDKNTYLDLQYQHTFSNDLDLTARFSYDSYDYDGTYIVDYAEAGAPPYVENKDFTRGKWWGLELNASKSLFRKHRVTTGVEYRDNLRQDQGNFDADPYKSYLDDKRSSKIWALYIQDEFRIKENLILNGGLRYDRYDTFGGTANPRLALIYSPRKRTSVKLLYGQAFRAPNYFEMFYGGSISNKPNPFLKPETIKTTEFVLEQYGKHFRFTVSGFYNDIAGLISQRLDPADDRILFSNVGDVASRGLEAVIEGRLFAGIESRTSYALQNSDNERTRDSLSNSPKHLAKMNLSVPLAGRKVFASFQGLYTSARRTFAGGNVDGFFLSNATLLSKSVFKGFDVSAGIYNLFNVRYADPGAEEHRQDSIAQDGRSFRLKLTYSFNRSQ